MKKQWQHHQLLLVLVVLFLFAGLTMADDQTLFDKSEIFIPGPDTIRLATDLYLPKANGPFACILIRTPYNKNGFQGDAKDFIQQGYAVVVQDTRGTGKSNSRFYAFSYEREDGLITLDWIRKQPWSNGRVGGWGGSYVGYTQMVIADKLDAITALVTTADMYDALYPSGIFSLATCMNWGLIMNNPKIKPEKLIAGYRQLPLSTVDDSTGAANAYFDDWLNHPQKDAYWQAQAFRKSLNTPVFSIAGWYDMFLDPQIKDFVALGQKRHPASRLIIGPFAHGKITIPTDFDEAAKLGRYVDLARSFLIQTVKHPVGLRVYADSLMNKPFAFFIVHANRWVLSDHWPPEQAKPAIYYLHPNHRLAQQKPTANDQVEYTYNPQDPYPSMGGSFLGLGVGPAWQNVNSKRTDQAVFETDSLNAALTLLGPMQAKLWVSSDAACTDFYACLQDVGRDGKIVNIQEGGAMWNGQENQDAKQLTINIWPAGYQLASGHKLRLVICSALFPRYNRNLNSCEPPFQAKTIKKAQQKILIGPDHPSQVQLSVLP